MYLKKLLVCRTKSFFADTFLYIIQYGLNFTYRNKLRLVNLKIKTLCECAFICSILDYIGNNIDEK